MLSERSERSLLNELAFAGLLIDEIKYTHDTFSFSFDTEKKQLNTPISYSVEKIKAEVQYIVIKEYISEYPHWNYLSETSFLQEKSLSLSEERKVVDYAKQFITMSLLSDEDRKQITIKHELEDMHLEHAYFTHKTISFNDAFPHLLKHQSSSLLKSIKRLSLITLSEIPISNTDIWNLLNYLWHKLKLPPSSSSSSSSSNEKSPAQQEHSGTSIGNESSSSELDDIIQKEEISYETETIKMDRKLSTKKNKVKGIETKIQTPDVDKYIPYLPSLLQNLEEFSEISSKLSLIRTGGDFEVEKFTFPSHISRRDSILLSQGVDLLKYTHKHQVKNSKYTVYCDVSYSMDKYIQGVFSLIRKIRSEDMIEKVFYFSQQVYEENKKYYTTNWGTDIQCVIEHLKSSSSSKNVILITDGACLSITEKYYSNGSLDISPDINLYYIKVKAHSGYFPYDRAIIEASKEVFKIKF